MKRTPDGRALHAPAIAQVGSHVGTMGVEDVRCAIRCAKQHQIAAKVVQWSHPTWAQFLTVGNSEPAVGQGQRKTLHGLTSSTTDARLHPGEATSDATAEKRS